MLARSTWGLAPCDLGAVVLVGAVDVIIVIPVSYVRETSDRKL